MVANLPPVSRTPAQNVAIGTAGVVDTDGKKWEQYQTADIIK
jgi:hypothetical protein